MNQLGGFLGLIALLTTAFACGANVRVDPLDGASSGGAGGSGTAGDFSACPSEPMDTDIEALDGKPCAGGAADCSSDSSGCGGCVLTCKNGVWAPRDSQLCTYLQDC